ncbi:hypothetical protein ZIOFF_072394 [Zingiber officinale]|uniref:Terpene synthase metal-binding domain-containing protein n=1 Tax=Zingiber officinale TaxID=94328 RepID=A0A8J5C5V1_ZINOF|nr:hypothetical protein ZIOFF_072394 [Zingiber officinale]
MKRQSMVLVGGDEEEIIRKSAEYHPTVWGDYFIRNCSCLPLEKKEYMIKRVEELKERVRNLFEETRDVLQIMILVDSIQLLGLDYHFEKEITAALRLIYEADVENYGLYEVSLRFRLLRQHGYYLSPVITSKAISLMSIMDDIYDNYSTMEESRLLTEAIERFFFFIYHLSGSPLCFQNCMTRISRYFVTFRWEPQAVNHVPEYLKDFYLKLLATCKDFEDELEPHEKYRIPYLQEEIKGLSRCYFQEVQWGAEGYVPSVEEHLTVSWKSTGYPAITCASYVGMVEDATKEAFEWVASFPKILKSSSIICRLMDDITSHELEQERDHVASTVESYMKEYGTNVKVAREKLRVMVERAWKDLNEECLRSTQVARSLIEIILNLSRAMEDIHKYIDGYTNSNTRMKDHVSLILVESFPI